MPVVSIGRLRQTMVGLLCFYVLGLLQSTSRWMRLQEEATTQHHHYHHHLWAGPSPNQKYDYRRKKVFRTSPRSKAMAVRHFLNESSESFAYKNKNNNNNSTRISTRKHNRRRRRPPPPKQKQKLAWWQALQEPELLLPKPIFVMGFPKAGTSSIFQFFQRQGLSKSQHWYCCKKQMHPQQGGPSLMAGCMLRNLARKNRTLFEGCGTFDLYSEINGPRRKAIDPKTKQEGYLQNDGSMDTQSAGPRIFFPQHFHIQELHDEFPNATWILNLRPVESWINSTLQWGDDLPEQFANEYYANHALDRLPSDDKEMRKFLKSIYQGHNDLVRSFVRNHPSHALIEVNITDDAAGEVLAEAFGLDAEQWPHSNQNRKYLDRWSISEVSFAEMLGRIFSEEEFFGSMGCWILVLLTFSGFLGFWLGQRWP